MQLILMTFQLNITVVDFGKFNDIITIVRFANKFMKYKGEYGNTTN